MSHKPAASKATTKIFNIKFKSYLPEGDSQKDPVALVLNGYGEGVTAGEILETVVGRYLYLMNRHRPELTRHDWMALIEVLGGDLPNGPWEAPGEMLATKVMEKQDEIGLFERWRINGPALISSLRAMNPVEVCSIIHTAEMYWCMDSQPSLSRLDALHII